jgi:hypothetical protein
MVALLLACALASAPSMRAQRLPARGDDWSSVDRALGRSGTLNPSDVMKYSFPRGDLQVTAYGVALKPALALGSWLAFKKEKGTATMVMGDLVLTEDEVDPVMRALQAGGVQETALHNHVLGESPRVMYMHVFAMGDAATIAQTVRSAFEHTHTPLSAPAPASASSAPVELDTTAIAQVLGFTGRVNGGVYQVSVPRREVIRHGGMVVPPAMGVATALNFQPTGTGRAAVTGDFVLVAGEVNAVTRALRENDIAVTAIHSHMLDEQPRLYFMHFWGNDDAVKLARGLAAALHQMAVKRG